MTPGLVSVVISSHNRPRELALAIESASRQSYNPLEIIVLDDASGPEVDELVHRISILDGRVRMEKNEENLGLRASRHIGAKLAEGEFIQFLDDDEVLHPEKIRLQVQALEEDPEIDVVSGQTEHFHTKPGDMGLVWNTFKGIEDVTLAFVQHRHPWGPTGPLWRSESLKGVGGYGAVSCPPAERGRIRREDYEHASYALLGGLRAKLMPYILCYACQSPNRERVSVDKAASLAKDDLSVFEFLADRLRTSAFDDEPEYRRAMRDNFLWTSSICLDAGLKSESVRAIGAAKDWANSDKDAKIIDILLDAVFSGRIGAEALRGGLPEMGVDAIRIDGWWKKVSASDEDLLEVPTVGRYRRRS